MGFVGIAQLAQNFREVVRLAHIAGCVAVGNVIAHNFLLLREAGDHPIHAINAVVHHDGLISSS
jgi:hypothetical protein